ncbi:hypothetical protein TD95_005141 [Thielaviopsis punctulata]|uniref:C2H2-type domain-containing protein n=1 Tax=Thielaviopsis punctulata TaxID=72032 RepID=A0A0F4ZLJ4_9PEZI|nr:hypothetical protein TD95_005141 [Thielaviopsis punctulata]
MTASSTTHQLELDRQMVRHLLNTYSKEQLARIFQEETRKPMQPNQADRSSMLSAHTTSTTLSDRSSVFDSASSVRSFSDASSISTSSIFSNVSSKLLGRKSSHASKAAAHTAAHASSSSPFSASSSTSTAVITPIAKQKTVFMCGFCSEEDIVKTCTRKNDLKRHMEDFHNMNAQWCCRHRGCRMVFDWQTAYKAHLKKCHGGSRMSLDEAKVNLCPQVVFACGFAKCCHVFEASGDADAPNMFKEYVAHVVKHFDDAPNVTGAWSYSTRMRNLLRQAQVVRVWEQSGWDVQTDVPLRWLPATSLVLRKRLECRHIDDAALMVEYAVQLGTHPERPLKHHANFVTPLRDSCAFSVPGHAAGGKSGLAPPLPVAQSFDFRISRNSDPALASYLASQRRVSVQPKRTQRGAHHYSSRSAGVNPNLTSSSLGSSNSNSSSGSNGSSSNNNNNNSHNSNHYFSPHGMPISRAPSMYDSHSQAAFVRTHGAVMPHGSGIIADDIQSLRSMAHGSPESADIAMADAEMLAQDFHHGYTGMSAAELGPGNGLDHHSPFFDDPTRPY